VLELDNVEVTLGTVHLRFDHELEPASLNVLLGRSGSGKSTLLNLIAGFAQPDHGDIRWAGKSLLPLSADQRPVNSLFQSHNLFAHLTITDNVGLALHPGLRLTRTDKTEVAEALAQVGLAAHGTRRPPELSGGEQQRAALARCLLRRKPILLMDEPFGALDGATRQDMLTLTREVIDRYRPCTLLVTHEPDDGDALGADRLLVEDGRLQSISGAPT